MTLISYNKTINIFKKSIEDFQNLLIVVGLSISFIGGSWDITYHLLNIPESFFSYPHTLVYFGILLVIVVFYTNFKNNFVSPHLKSYKLENVIILIGTLLILSAGPFDYYWHEQFGLDGLLSPPHTVLLSGWLVVGWGNLRILLKSMLDKNKNNQADKEINGKYVKSLQPADIEKETEPSQKKSIGIHFGELMMHTPAVLLNISFILLIVSGFLYFFSLPFSETQYYNFNPNPVIALVVYGLGFSFLFSFYFLQILYIWPNKFGYISIIAASYVIIMLVTQITSNPMLANTSFLYLLNLIPFIGIDLANYIFKNRPNKYNQDEKKSSKNITKGLFKNRFLVFGLILGLTTYSLCFPLNTYIFNEILIGYLISQDKVITVYKEIFYGFYPLVVALSIIGGLLGFLASSIFNIKNKSNIFIFKLFDKEKQLM